MTDANTDAAQKTDVSIVLCGQAGQGIQTVEKILVHCLKQSGFHVYATKEYMSRVRGGVNSTEIRISSGRVSAYIDRIDILLPFHQRALFHLAKRITPETTVIGDRQNICTDCPDNIGDFQDIPLAEMADAIGGKIFMNIIAAGVILGMFGADLDGVLSFIRQFFSRKSDEIIQKNQEAIRKGYEQGQSLLPSLKKSISLTKSSQIGKEILVNGAEAVGLGALAGNCNFLSSYPMSPSTGVMVFLAQHSDQYDIIVEQVEDEISAINMALGASYAGARSLVTTSGGGFALMTEGVSLAGMTETPVVIHVAQRPGPATGLPTRTEQADLEFVLYSGHGEFPRVIFAPGSLEDAFHLSQRAFNLADKFQIPVFILTDQYFMDSYYNTPPFDLHHEKNKKYIAKTTKDYQRFALTENGISPRGIPGHGEGLVGVDSDEHGEDAHITENLDLRTNMVDKRLKKLELIKKETLPPTLIGPENYKVLVIGWGSTFNTIKEALDEIGRDDVAFLYFNQVYPLHEKTRQYLQKTEKAIIVENNATSQFGKLIKRHTDIKIEHEILKYSGLAFSVEELVQKIGEKL